MKISEIKEWLKDITDDQLEEYFIFAFVRNPYSRLISLSKYFGVSVSKFVVPKKYKHMPPIAKAHSIPCSYYTHLNGNCFADFIGKFETIQRDYDKVCGILGLNNDTLPVLNKTIHGHYAICMVKYKKILPDIDKKYHNDFSLLDYKNEIF